MVSTESLFSSDRAKEIIRKKKVILFDCDGVLWRSGVGLPSAAEFVNSLSPTKKVFFVTNNSGGTPAHLTSKLARIGITATEDQVISAPLVTAKVLSARGVKKVFLLANTNMVSYLKSSGIEAIEADFSMNPNDIDGDSFTDPAVQAVVAGATQDLNYSSLAQALQYLLKPEVAFIATNRDPTFPGAHSMLPGANTVVSALIGCSGRQPEVMGKPEPFVYEALEEMYGIDRKDCVIVGDRLSTDIELAVRGGSTSILVLTGVTPAESWHEMAESMGVIPDAVVGGVADIVGWDVVE
ncbi:HAD-superfamily hydrolase subfamily IIA [Carpediemonas membranifera]|uniref:HAD-superfamily hydrolase subfamily IIA n=1 Tax=Carpediemonas membranifera TaxID=201153 RepID=A0A8J6E3N4_9EUKA|nr:HAD-superfamily hydrolase subfamily IIA [Carpediemonas membranifera]|eukprot:KAG9396158.1 HAD-superfamily hydrolase subfamily IIA [Carpediemonas membranifera]